MFSFIRFSCVLCGLLVLLVGCGGGGGGSAMRPSMDSMDQTPQTPPIVDSQTAFGTAGDRPSLTPSRYRPALTGGLRQSDPAFGSVGATLYSPNLSPLKKAETTFTEDRFTLSVERQNGSGFTLDTNRHYAEVVNDDSLSTNPVSNRPFAAGYMASVNGAQATVAGASVEWSRMDVTDYLAGGYWMFVDVGSNAVEMGAFIDGTDYPTPSDAAYDLPVTGTATYRGRAGGLYVAAAGTDTLSPGATELGEYEGRASLTANFGTMRINGLVDQVQTLNVVGQHANGVPYANPYLEDTDLEMVFQPVPINSNGTFFGDNVKFTSQDYTITSSSGSWAGQFSTVDDSQGNPRAAAGTNTGYGETAEGSRFILTGAFYGATERFE